MNCIKKLNLFFYPSLKLFFMPTECNEQLLSQALEFAKQLAQKAGALACEIQRGNMDSRSKGPKDIVTAGDLACDALIKNEIQKHYPNWGIWTEESGQSNMPNAYDYNPLKGFTWIVDPIDGTVNYSRGIPLWGIAIALLHNGKPVVGCIELPMLKETYWAAQGMGAFCTFYTQETQTHALNVSSTSCLKDCIVSNGDFNVGNHEQVNAQNCTIFASEAQHCQRVKCVGSAAVETAFVAAGRLDAYVMTMSYPWDIAAGTIIIQEAGGQCTLLNGAPIEMTPNAQVLFSNKLLHSPLLSILTIPEVTL
jgi:myo-inositol-1(or 4)-monophosphatase